MRHTIIQHVLLLTMLAGCGTPVAPRAGVETSAAVRQPTSTAAAFGVPQSTLSAQHATEEARLLMAGATTDAQASTPVSVPTPTAMPTSDIAAPAAISLIDPQQPLTSADDPQWQFQRTATADFDGDGVEERAVLIARIELVDGQPAWDDGQPWQMYIEEPDGTRTYVYARFLQLGSLEALLTGTIEAQVPGITLLERTPFSFAVYDVRYRGPQQVEVIELLLRELDSARGFMGTAE